MMEIRGARVIRGGRSILDGVDLCPEPGRVTAVIGLNGAGKSSLVKLVSGEWTPDDGRVLWRGRPLRDWDPRQVAARRAVVNQHVDLRFDFSVREVVEMGRFPHRGLRASDTRARVERALSEVDLLELADRSALRISGGERRRMLLARALAQLAEAREAGEGMLVLDEPTAHLDLRHQERLLRGMRDWAAEGVTVLAVLHDLNHAARVADHVVLMDRGRVAAAGPANAVLRPGVLSPVFGVDLQRLERPGRPPRFHSAAAADRPFFEPRPQPAY